MTISEKDYYSIKEGDIILVTKVRDTFDAFVIDPPTDRTFILTAIWLDHQLQIIVRDQVKQIIMRRTELCCNCIVRSTCNVRIHGLYCYFERIIKTNDNLRRV